MIESTIERRLKKEVEARKGLCIKLTGLTGIPDRLILLPMGKVGFIETKKPGEKPRKAQQIWAKRLRRLGFLVFTLDDGKEIQQILDEIQTS